MLIPGTTLIKNGSSFPPPCLFQATRLFGREEYLKNPTRSIPLDLFPLITQKKEIVNKTCAKVFQMSDCNPGLTPSNKLPACFHFLFIYFF